MADATMTIAVRVQDQATRALASLGQRVRTALLAPFTFLGKQIAATVKSMISLRSLLIGGGGIALITKSIGAVSRYATTFEEAFDERTQARIDAVQTAINRLGATIKGLFGQIISDQSEGLAGFFDSISAFLRDHKADIVQFVRDMRDFFRDAAAFVKAIGSGKIAAGTLSALLNPFGGDKRGDFQRIAQGIARQRVDDAVQAFRDAAKEAGLTGAAAGGADLFASALDNIGFGLETSDLEAARVALDALHASAKQYAEDGTASPTAQAQIINDVANALRKYTENARLASGETVELAKTTARFIVELTQVADIMASSVTDGFFDIIEGTKSVGRAFTDMVSGILRDVGRLLINNALTSFFGSLLGVPGGNPFTGVFGNSTSRAVGGPAQGPTVVGERGPERVFLPRGSRVERTDQGGGGGSVTVNVIGARDAAATAREVIAQLRRNGALRQAVRLA